MIYHCIAHTRSFLGHNHEEIFLVDAKTSEDAREEIARHYERLNETRSELAGRKLQYVQTAISLKVEY